MKARIRFVCYVSLLLYLSFHIKSNSTIWPNIPFVCHYIASPFLPDSDSNMEVIEREGEGRHEVVRKRRNVAFAEN